MSTPLDLRILRAMKIGLDTVVGLRVSLNVPEEDVRDGLARLVQGGLVRASEDGTRFVPTPAGLEIADAEGRTTTATFGQVTTTHIRLGGGSPEPEWREVSDMVSQAFASAQAARKAASEQQAAVDRARELELLATDAEREAVLTTLAGAYGDGRLTEEEHEARAHQALEARTRGDLDAVLTGLGPARSRVAQGSTEGHNTALLVLAILAIPFVLLLTLLVARALMFLAVPLLIVLLVKASRRR